MSTYYTLPQWKSGFDLSFIVMTILMIFLATFITYMSVKNISKENPALAIRPKSPKIFKSGFFEKTKFWNKLSFNSRWNFRDAKRNKIRGIMIIIGVIGCTVLLISAFAMNDTMNDLKDWQYGDINHYNSKLVIDDDATADEVQKVVTEVNGDKIIKGSVEINVGDIKKTGTLLVNNETPLITHTDENRNSISLPSDGLSMSIKMASLLNVKKGDSIK